MKKIHILFNMYFLGNDTRRYIDIVIKKLPYSVIDNIIKLSHFE